MLQIACGQWHATILPEHGANVISLRCGDEQILRMPDTEQDFAAHPCLYGLPILLPANRVADGAFTYEGRQYTLPINEPARHNHIHGLLNNTPFTVVDLDDAHVVTRLCNDGAYYPFPFVLTFTDRLTETGLHRTITLENTGALPMPYTMAFHTTFVAPTTLQVPLSERYVTDERMLPTGEMAQLTGWEQDCANGMTINGHKFSGSFTSGGNTAKIGDYHMTVSGQFDHWIVFNGSGNDGYLCIEPQCGAVNGLNNGRHLVLQPGCQEVFSLSITRQ